MLKKENPTSMKRHKFLQKSMEMGLSSHTEMELVECMDGKPDSEKEKLAEQLLKIISTSKSEQEMIQRAEKLR